MVPWSPAITARISPDFPSVDFKAGTGVVQYDAVMVTSGSAASSSVNCLPAAALVADEASPSSAVPTMIRFGEPPKCSVLSVFARVDSAPGSSNPPAESCPKAPAPSAAEPTNSKPPRISTSRA